MSVRPSGLEATPTAATHARRTDATETSGALVPVAAGWPRARFVEPVFDGMPAVERGGR